MIVVEDNPDAAETLSDLLELAGHEVTIAEDGRRALELLRSRGADIVLCDLGLPGMSGFEFAQAVRRDPAIADVPLVAVTGYGQPEDRRRSANAGFDEHLTKPVDIGAVHAVIARLSFP